MRSSIIVVFGLVLSLRASEQDLLIPRLTLRQIHNNTDHVVRIEDNLRNTWFLLEPHTTIITELLLDGDRRPVTEYMDGDVVVKRLTMLGHFYVRNNVNFWTGCTYNFFIQHKINKKPSCVTNQFDRQSEVRRIYSLKEDGPIAVELTVKDNNQGSFDLGLVLDSDFI